MYPFKKVNLVNIILLLKRYFTGKIESLQDKFRALLAFWNEIGCTHWPKHGGPNMVQLKNLTK